MSVDLTISIVLGSRPQLLIDALESLFASLTGALSTEVWVVDNCSPDPIEPSLLERFPSIKVVRNATRKGFGANHNSIISTTSSRYVLILNDDVSVHYAACEKLVEAADAHPDAGVLGPRLVNPDGSLQKSAYKFPSIELSLAEAFALDKAGIYDNYSHWNHQDERIVDYLTGAALLVRRTMIEEVGTFDEDFFMYGEETDWCMRAAKAGWKTLLVPDAVITHIGGQSTVGLEDARAVEFLRGHEKLLRKHHGSPYVAAYKGISLVKHLPRWLVYSVSGNDKVRMERDIVLWSLGLLRRPGLKELLTK